MTDRYAVTCIYGNIQKKYVNEHISVTVPGSKSITNRALLLASLADGESVLNGAMLSGDSRVFIECLNALGVAVSIEPPSHANDQEALPGNVTLHVHGTGGLISGEASINVGSAGTAARFLTAMMGACGGSYYLDSSEQMKKRPMGPLIDSLRKAGCNIICPEKEGHFPIKMDSDGFKSFELEVNIDDSSQFLSALLMAGVMSEDDLTINVSGTHGMAYIDMTEAMMSKFGVRVLRSAPSPDDTKSTDTHVLASYTIKHAQKYTAQTYDIEPDASAAAYFYALSAILGISVSVNGVHFDSLQGDTEFIRILEKMGCHAEESSSGIILYPPEDGIIHGISVDMSAFSDQAITLAAIAPFADSPTTITGIGHIRKQESDRLSGIATELGKMGIRTKTTDTSVTIFPGTPKPSVVNTYDDHRMAMGFSLTGLRAPGIVIDNPGCCSKTFENYFPILDGIIQKIKATDKV